MKPEAVSLPNLKNLQYFDADLKLAKVGTPQELQSRLFLWDLIDHRECRDLYLAYGRDCDCDRGRGRDCDCDRDCDRDRDRGRGRGRGRDRGRDRECDR